MDLKKKRQLVFIVCCIALTVLMISMIVMRVSFSTHQKVTAVITDIVRSSAGNTRGSNSPQTYISYSYSYKGKAYQITLPDYFPAGKQDGQTVTLALDPSDPSQADNGSQFYASLLLFCLLATFTVVLQVTAVRSKRNPYG